MKVTILIVFWNSTPERIINVEVVWQYVNYFLNTQQSDIEFELRLFDFSPKPTLSFAPDHKAFPEGFNRSKKQNIALSLIDCDTLFLLDADIIFLESEYDRLIAEIQQCNTYQGVITYDIQAYYAPYFFRERIRQTHLFKTYLRWGTGGLVLIPFKPLIEIGGYDERFTVWGGEDDDLYKRLERKIGRKRRFMKNIRVLHLPHKQHTNIKQTNQYKKQFEIVTKNLSIKRPTLLNNYQV